MSVVSGAKGEDQDGFYGGTKKRPLSIIEEDDSDDGGSGPTSPVTGEVVQPAPEISTKDIVIETKISSPAATQPAAKSNGVKKNDQKKRPQNIDTSRAKSQSSGSKPKSPSSKTAVSSDSKSSSRISNFPKSIRIAPESEPNSKKPPPVAPKPKTPSPSPSKVKSPSFPSQTSDRHFAFQKSPTSSPSKKTAAPKSKTPDTQTSEVEVVRSMKNIVKRTVSKIENHVASMASSTKQKVKGDTPRRKISREEVPISKPSSKEKENSTAKPTSKKSAAKSDPSSTSTPSSNKTQELTITVTPASPTDEEKATGNADSTSSSEKSENCTDIQTSDTTPSEETEIVASNTTSKPASKETENPPRSQNSTHSSNETESCMTENSTAIQKSTRESNETESNAAGNPTAIQTSTLESFETESNAAENYSATQQSVQMSNETQTDAAENTTDNQKAIPTYGEKEISTAIGSSPTDDAERPTSPQTSNSSSRGTENPVGVVISIPNYEADKQTTSQIPTPSSGAESQTVPLYSQLSTDEADVSSSNDTESEDALRYHMANSRFSTPESSTPEFATPPSSPPMSQSKQLPSVLFSPLLSSRTSHSISEVSRASGSGSCNSKSSQMLSDGQGLARIREAAECLKLKSSASLVPKSSPSPPSRRVPFSFRGSPKLAHRPFTEGYSLSSLNNSKPLGPFNLNVLSVPSQSSDSESEDKSQSKTGEKSRIAPRSPFLAPKFHPRRGSYFFKRRISSESLASLSENESADNAEEPTPISASDFNKLKETADRLHLSTRRPSVLQWRQQYVESPGASGFSFKSGMNGDSLDEKLTSERKQKIDEALDWLRNELHEMRSQDQILARQLLTIRNDIHQLKLRRCTTEHQELLDDFKLEIEEQQEFSDVLDIPQPIYEDNPLKHIGVTRLNISARRFSAC